jgi:multifunctional methyltransferase subunit TRM112
LRDFSLDGHRTQTGYPLKIEADYVTVEESPFNPEMIRKMLPRLNYAAIVQANRELSIKTEEPLADLPEKLPSDIDEPLLHDLHRVLFDVHLVEGFLVCPSTGRRFPVKDSIPNMLLHEDEI